MTELTLSAYIPAIWLERLAFAKDAQHTSGLCLLSPQSCTLAFFANVPKRLFHLGEVVFGRPAGQHAFKWRKVPAPHTLLAASNSCAT